MIAVARRRIGKALASAARATRRVDRAAAIRFEKLRPPLEKRLRRLRVAAVRWAKAAGRRLRPVGVLVLRAFARGERGLRRAAAWGTRAATRLSAVITPRRATAGVILASAGCLLAAQFVAYHGVEIDQSAYAGLPAATPPTVAVKDAGDAHAYLLVPVAALAALVAVLALRRERRGLGRVAMALGLISLAVILLVDLPAGLDAGAQSSRFAGATAVLEEGFYAELAAAAGLVFGGLLLVRRPRARKPRLARTQGGRRGARTWSVRKRDGRPRTKPGEGLQRPA